MPKRQSDSDMENPREFAAWAFAAGIPDPRGKHQGYQSIIPAPCFPMISQMLWDFGFRHDPALQKKWVPEYAGGDRNMVPLGVTDASPEDVLARATEMVVDQFPEVADRIASMTAENRDEMLRAQAKDLLASVDRLRAATGDKGSGL